MHRSSYMPRRRYPHHSMQTQFYLIYVTSLFCLIATGWAAALFL
jgi:hypothetical protein